MSGSLGTSRTPAGYTWLVDRYKLAVVPNWHRSFVSPSGIHRVDGLEEAVEETYTRRYWPGDSVGDHLEFALKYDGINLAILVALFEELEKTDAAELLRYIRCKPTGKYARRVWFLFELLTGTTLPLDDLSRVKYVDLLEPHVFYTIREPRQVKRQAINDNLLGDARFCPTVRRTDALHKWEAANLPDRCRQVVGSYPPEQLQRAISYLYMKETKSSFEIEHIQPSSTRVERFVGLLRLAEREDFCEQDHLIGLQNQVVEPRFQESGYRTVQNYVGQTAGWRREIVHYVCPKPEDVPQLMAGLVAAHQRMEAGAVAAVAAAAAVAYGFVYIHPFEDGNGRIHRFLIHNILARRGFTPEGIVFPVSAAMLHDPLSYGASLEAFSRPLMELIDYTLDDQGRLDVEAETARFYRYIDLTPQVEALYRFIERAIDTELVDELTFITKYDAARQALQDIVDMPDRKIDLFIRLCAQNQGRLSDRKRASQFEFLSDDEVSRMEQAVQAAYEQG